MNILRRRLARRVSRALHEARRPLQLLALRDDASAELAQIAHALDEIEAIVHGKVCPAQLEPTPIGRLLADAAERYRSLADPGFGRIDVIDQTADARPLLDRPAIVSAVDNLVANAVEHGRGPVEIRAAASETGAELTIRNMASEQAGSSARSGNRGHGLEVVAEVARRSGGRFELRRAGNEAVATLSLGGEEPLTVAS